MGKDKGQLGRALTKSKTRRTKVDPDRADVYRTNDDDKTQRMMSHTNDKSDLEELLEIANLDERTFEAEKQNVVVITSSAMQLPSKKDINKERMQQWNVLTIPRRPPWTTETTPEELNKLEKETFLSWRRDLARLEEEDKFIITPFEKNLEVWRQLWRVIEKSDLVCQILDARNPLLFRCPDVEKYVKEVDTRKRVLLIINKADLLTKRQRFFWAKYFKSSKLDYVFFSAQAEENDNATSSPSSSDAPQQKAIRVLSSAELIEHFSVLCPEPIDPSKSSRIVVGLIGYPNVGKSSTINVLVGEKKVAVAPTPGKTKHFQTLNLTDEIMLCDCPGLVFPTVVGTKADMVCDGLLPIDQTRDFTSPIQLVCDRIPRDFLEQKYGIALPALLPDEHGRKPTAEEVLNAYAFVRGFMTQSGLPDQSRAARIILKDYVQGRILYCHPPPGVSEEEFLRKRGESYQPLGMDDQGQTLKKPTYTDNSKRSPYDENYDQYLHKQDKVVAMTSGKHAKFNYTRTVGAPYSAIPVAQLEKDPKLVALLSQGTQKLI